MAKISTGGAFRYLTFLTNTSAGAASFRESFRLALTALGVVRMTVRYAVCLKKNGVEPKYYRWFGG